MDKQLPINMPSPQKLRDLADAIEAFGGDAPSAAKPQTRQEGRLANMSMSIAIRIIFEASPQWMHKNDIVEALIDGGFRQQDKATLKRNVPSEMGRPGLKHLVRHPNRGNHAATWGPKELLRSSETF